jgi:hypothetical protein
VAIDTFMTELSSVMRNCPAASVISTEPAAAPATPAALDTVTSELTAAA